MQTMLIRESYKIVRSLDVGDDYAFVEGVDIRDREKSACFLNLYEGEWLPVYLDILDRMKSRPDMKELFIAEGTLVAVFPAAEGPCIDQIFYRGAGIGWETRLQFAELLLHRALSLSDLPAEVACSAMLSENILVDLSGGRLHTRWYIPPTEGMNGRELVYLTVDQLKKILLRHFYSPMVELEFMQILEDGACKSVVQLYSLWREWQRALREAYEKQQEQNIIKRTLVHVWKHVKWGWKRRKKR